MYHATPMYIVPFDLIHVHMGGKLKFGSFSQRENFLKFRQLSRAPVCSAKRLPHYFSINSYSPRGLQTWGHVLINTLTRLQDNS